MFYVMSSATDIIVVAAGNVRYHQSIGFSVDSRHGSVEAAERAAESEDEQGE